MSYPKTNEAKLLTRQQFLALYALSSTTFYREVAAGRLRVLKVGAATRIATNEAERWAASLPAKEGAAE